MTITDVIDGLSLDNQKWTVLSDKRKCILQQYYEENYQFLGLTLLLKILRAFPDCRIYMRKPRVTNEAIYRVVYTEDGVKQETFLHYEGDFESGHKPKLSKIKTKFSIGTRKIISKGKNSQLSISKER